MTTFQNYDDAMNWLKINGRDNARPCDKLEIVEIEKAKWAIAIKFKVSGLLVGYAS